MQNSKPDSASITKNSYLISQKSYSPKCETTKPDFGIKNLSSESYQKSTFTKLQMARRYMVRTWNGYQRVRDENRSRFPDSIVSNRRFTGGILQL